MPYPGTGEFPGGPLPALATVQELANFAQITIPDADPVATFLLQVASGMIRARLEQAVTLVTDDIEYLDPVNGSFASLSQSPVIAVSKVEITDDDGTTWATVPPTDYRASKRLGTLTAKPWTPTRWPADEESWRVTYTHGFATVPDELKGVCTGLAARYYSTPIAVELERIGQRQVKYAIESEGFSALESMALAVFRLPRSA